MPHAVRLSDELVAAAKRASSPSGRSVPSQIEYWASLGRTAELVLAGHALELLTQSQGDVGSVEQEPARKRALLAGLRHAFTREARAPTCKLLASRGVRYGTDPGDPAVLMRVDPDGTKTRGRLLDDEFVPLPAAGPRTKKTAGVARKRANRAGPGRFASSRTKATKRPPRTTKG